MSTGDLGRVRWRCRRGMKELDFMLNRYVDRHWASDDEAQRQLLWQLLDCEDDQLWDWLSGRVPCSDGSLRALVERIRQPN